MVKNFKGYKYFPKVLFKSAPMDGDLVIDT